MPPNITAWTYQVLITCFSGLVWVALLLILTQRITNQDGAWMTIPIVGAKRNGWFPWARGVFRSITNSRLNALEGYKKFSQHDTPFVVPSTGCGAIVVLPTSQFCVLNKSEAEIEALGPQMESHQPHYTMDDIDVYKDLIHFDIVRTHMTKSVGQFARLTAEELDSAFQEYAPNGKEWGIVSLWETCTKVIARVGNRAYVGSHDEEFLEQSRLYATSVYGSAAIITAIPSFLRPILGPLIAFPARVHLSRCKKILIPIVEKRLERLKKNTGPEPSDVLQWLIQRCAKAGTDQLDPSKIALRLLILNLTSIYTTSYAFANCMQDIYSSPHRDDFIAGLRAECGRVSGQHDGIATKEAVDQLLRVDSAIRESMRISAFGIVAMFRNVVPGTLLDLGNGVQIPGGTRIAIPCQPVHLDESRYINALEFDAFRFSRQFEGPQDELRKVAGQKLSVDLDDSFLTYGYGKHACPGRWFASQMMKQALAYMVQNYDVEYVGYRLEKKVVLNMVMPDLDARIRVRRRK